MDILNFISWLRGGRLVKTVDPAQSLIPVATRDTTRDDGWLTNAMTVEDLAAQLAPAPAYKVYTALLTQTGTDAPVATVLENTLGGTPVWYRNDVGSYIIELIGAFTTNKTIIIPPFNSSATGGVLGTNIEVFGCGLDSGEDSLYLTTGLQNVSTGGITASDNILYASPGQFIEIRVYN